MKVSFTKYSHADDELCSAERCATTCTETRDSNPAGVRECKRVSKFCRTFGLVAVLAMGATISGCHHHDEREPVLPPVVEAAPNTLAGVVTDIAGVPVAGAKVSLGDPLHWKLLPSHLLKSTTFSPLSDFFYIFGHIPADHLRPRFPAQ